MRKPAKKPKTFRVSPETIEILNHTAEATGYESHTALMEEAIYHYCAYLLHQPKSEKD